MWDWNRRVRREEIKKRKMRVYLAGTNGEVPLRVHAHGGWEVMINSARKRVQKSFPGAGDGRVDVPAVGLIEHLYTINF